MRILRSCAWIIGLLAPCFIVTPSAPAATGPSPVTRPSDPTPLPQTAALEMTGDIASQLVDGVDRFLIRETDWAAAEREKHWNRDLASPERYAASIRPNRERLAHILGLRDARASSVAMELVASTTQPAAVGRGRDYDVLAVRWPAFGDVHGEGLLLQPLGREPLGDIIAIPDCAQTPEQLAGLAPGIEAKSLYVPLLAQAGYRVIVPTLIDRATEVRPKLPAREFVYRAAYELGRHLIGYEVQKTLATVDWFESDAKARGRNVRETKVGVIGWGEGGMIALYAAALDPRIGAVCVSGYVDDRRGLWRQPVDRNVFGLLRDFGDAELLAMVAPRAVIVEAAQGPTVTLPAGGKGAPAELTPPDVAAVRKEVERANSLVAGLKPSAGITLVESGGGNGPHGCDEALRAFAGALVPSKELLAFAFPPQPRGPGGDPAIRQQRQFAELDRHNQQVLRDCADDRVKFMAKLDPSSPEKYAATSAEYRRIFYDDVIGRFDQPLLPMKPRSRKAYESEKWIGYEVVLDVFPDVIAYGILLLPKDLKPGEKRPVVVCQHGLEGRPQDVIGESQFKVYQAFAARLAEQGFITFAPQNLYIFKDRFRSLQRKANPLGKTLYSIITPQHQQILNWLKTLPQVDGSRIAFYGLSYGGKTAMRVPALLTDYCLSICSGDFNEWVAKNASTHSEYSYATKAEYEIFEWDLGSTFNYAEMAALIAPRPFMVERGHFDGVGSDEAVAYEFAKVRFLYEAKLGLNNQCRIEWFNGPHMIHGVATYEFLHEKLEWPQREWK